MSASAAVAPPTQITHFRGILFPPAPVIFSADDQKRRDELIKLVIDDSIANKDTAGHLVNLTNFNNEFTAAVIEAHAPSPRKKLVDEWIDGVQAALKGFVQDSNGVRAANTVFLASIPEFGLNAYISDQKDPADNYLRKFDARNAIPDTLETYIVGRLRKMLTTDFHASRVLFMISCCTYGTTMRQDDPVGTRNRHKKLGGKSQITVIPSSPVVNPDPVNSDLRRIPKKTFGDQDGWGVERFTNIYVPAEIRFDIAFPRDTGTPPALGFTTCVDIEKEDHDNVNLCMYFGAGFPLENMKDTTHSFLLNDVKGWFCAGKTEKMYRTGYYHMSDKLPLDISSSSLNLGDMIKDAKGANFPVKKEASKYWFALGPSQSFPPGPVDCYATKPISFPRRTSSSSSCTIL